MPVAIDRPESWSLLEFRSRQPVLKVPNWTGFGIRPVGNANLAACTLLIGLGATEVDRETVSADSDVLDSEAGEFASTETAGVSNEQQSAITNPLKITR
jgi:hypothetical protein